MSLGTLEFAAVYRNHGHTALAIMAPQPAPQLTNRRLKADHPPHELATELALMASAANSHDLKRS